MSSHTFRHPLLWLPVRRCWLPAMLAVLAACSEDPQKNIIAVEPPPEGYPLSYLSAAINTREAVRWTNNTNGRITVKISVDDVNAPAELNRSFWKSAVPAETEKWLTVLRADGHDISTDIKFQSESGPVSTDSGAVLLITFKDRFNSRTAGTTQMNMLNINRCFVDETITLALRDSNGTAFPEYIRSTVLLHEFGHALGIFALSAPYTAHSPDSTDIMFPMLNNKQRGLSSGDQQTMQHLYSFTPRYKDCKGPMPLAKTVPYIIEFRLPKPHPPHRKL